jgi:hypothetical protein
MATRLRGAAPVMRGSAGFHDDVRRWLVLKEASELGTSEAAPTDHLAGAIGFRDFEYLLGEVHSNRRSIHSGLLLEVN